MPWFGRCLRPARFFLVAPRRVPRYARALLVVLALAGVVFAPARAAVDAAVVEGLKAATVYVVISAGADIQSGSGFLVHVNGDRAVVATNAHVVRDVGPAVRVEVVFHSGTRRARRIPAEVISSNAQADLAFLSIVAPDLPAPIDVGKSMAPFETQAVLIAGYPFGKRLATNRDTPSITLSRGAVSSQRLDLNDEPEHVQIDGDINPGNSGGPIVDESGALVGVSVATVRRTNIGFAIPAARVQRALAGAVVDLVAQKRAEQIRIIGTAVEPVHRIEEVTLLVGAGREDALPKRRTAAGRWKRITAVRFQVPMVRKEGWVGEFAPPVNEDEQRYIGQFRVRTRVGSHYMPPFRIINRQLAVALEGPNVAGEESGSAATPDTGATPSIGAVEEKSIRAVLARSGVSSYLAALAADPETLFEGSHGKQAEDFKRRLVEVLGRTWDLARIEKHFVDVFGARFDRDHLDTTLRTFNLPVVERLNVNVGTLDRYPMRSLGEMRRRASGKGRLPISAKRMELVRGIDRSRRLTDQVVYGYENSLRTVLQLVNSVLPKGSRMSPQVLEREVADDILKVRSRIGERVSLMLLTHYEKATDRDLSDFLTSLQSPALGWFVDREYAAYTTMVSERLDEAQAELLGLFEEAQRESLGLEGSLDLEGMNPDQAIDRILEVYGKEAIVSAIIELRGGQITVRNRGARRSVYGKPDFKLVSAETIAQDLSILHLSPEAFAKRLDRRAVADRTRAKSQERAAAVDCIQACRTELRQCYRKARSCRRPDGVRARNCRAYRAERRALCGTTAANCAEICTR